MYVVLNHILLSKAGHIKVSGVGILFPQTKGGGGRQIVIEFRCLQKVHVAGSIYVYIFIYHNDI